MMDRAIATEMHRFGRGANSLRAVAGAAPLIGVIGTMFGIAGSFPAIVGERTEWPPVAIHVGHVCGAILLTAAGMLVGFMAAGFRRYLSMQLERFEWSLRGY